MTAYTIALREVVKMYDLGLKDYPIFDEDYRKELNNLIFEHFKFREIGFETPEMFIDRLNHRMRLIMPARNRVYLSLRKDLDPLQTMYLETTGNQLSVGDIKRIASANISSDDELISLVTENASSLGIQTNKHSRDGKSSSKANANSKARAIGSQFPQTILSDNGDYASSGNDTISGSDSVSDTSETINEDVENNTNNKEDSRTNRNDNRTSTEENKSDESVNTKSNIESKTVISGRNGSMASLFSELSGILMSADALVLDDLDSLFMRLFATNEEYAIHQSPYYSQPFWPYF